MSKKANSKNDFVVVKTQNKYEEPKTAVISISEKKEIQKIVELYRKYKQDITDLGHKISALREMKGHAEDYIKAYLKEKPDNRAVINGRDIAFYETTKVTKKVNWEEFKDKYPKIYNELVTESINYYDKISDKEYKIKNKSGGS